MPFNFRKRKIEEPEIPTASMADIAFLLIIFFMLTTIFSRAKGLKMVLPEKSTEIVKIKSENMMRISINPEGKIFIDDAIIETPIYEIKNIVRERIKENPKLIVLIKTNISAPYNRMIEVYDEVLQGGADKVALQSIKGE
ncbi:MAG: biopolymer transporter ExbD [candidate division WOR-3 bacterium]|uniref:Biopolymer transporter ExbD n=1 Tax=candidate division WOR-3 bacterium TaxID=2052148 RepID=A0A7V3ZT97_UNCW3